MRAFNRFLLAGTSHLAILVMGIGGAWAGWQADQTNPSSPVAGPVDGPNAANGADGAAANGEQAAVNGTNGNGSAGILVTNSDADLIVSSGRVTGGTGGNGGAGAGNGSIGGNGGNSVGIMVTGQNAKIIVNSGATVSGGIAGSKGNGGLSDGESYGVRVEGANTSVTIESGATLTANGTGVSVANGLYLQAANVTVVNRGTITSTLNQNSRTGVIGMGDQNSNANITNYGSIIGHETSAVDNWSGTASLTNASGGTIEGRTAIHVGPSGSLTLVNNGTIRATGNETAISLSDSTQENSITNKGTINGDIQLGVVSNSDHLVYLEAGSTLNGSIYAAQANNGNVNIGANGTGTATIFGDIGSPTASIHALSIINGSTLKFGSNSDIYSNNALYMTNGGTFDVGEFKITFHTTGGQSDDDVNGQVYIKTTINRNTGTHGYFVTTGYAMGSMYGPPGSGGTPPIIVPTVIGTLPSGAQYVIIQDTTGRDVGRIPTVVNSGGYTWKVSSVTGAGQTDTDGVSYGTGYTNIIITNSGTNAAGAASGTNGAGVKALAAYSGGNAAMTALSQAVNNLTSAAEIEKAGAQLRPSANGATTQAALGAVGQAVNTISVRTDSVRAASADMGGAASGVSSGEALRGLGMWGQAFGSVATQDRRLGIDGYTADTYGVAFGADAKVAEPVRLGLSFAYARTGVDDAGAREGSGQTINSYIGSLYGTYSASRWYLDGALTYGHHTYDGTRVINIAGAARQTAKSSYGGNQYGAKAEVGVPFAVGSGIVVTPLAGLAYNHLRQDGYTEKDAAAALTVGSSSTDSVKSSLGAKAAATLARWRDWDVRPNARAVWSHEFNTKAHDQTSAYVDGGAAFTNTGTDAAGESFTLGIGLDLASVRNTTLSAKYDAGLSDRYVSHTGSLQARMEF